MKKTLYIVVAFCCFFLFSQTSFSQVGVDQLLNAIEQNNTQLKALREMGESEKLANRTTNNLVNPEVEVSHKPKAGGAPYETEIEATQSFDFPTAYRHRGQLIDLQNERVDLAYDVKRREVLQEARNLAINYIFQQKQVSLLTQRADYGLELFTAYQEMFDRGEINILERNKTKLNLLEVQKDLELAKVDLDGIRNDLVRMNGGIPISLELTNYTTFLLPADFDTWFQSIQYNNPNLQMANQEISLSKKQEQLTRSLNLPKLRAGYVGDLVRNENRHGFLVSVSVPLWEGRNTVKTVKAQTLAKEYEKEDATLQFKNQLKTNFEKLQKSKLILKEYSEVLDNSNNFALLKKSLDMGQLSLIEYLQELLLYYTAVDNYLAAERDYYLMLGELEQWQN